MDAGGRPPLFDRWRGQGIDDDGRWRSLRERESVALFVWLLFPRFVQ